MDTRLSDWGSPCLNGKMGLKTAHSQKKKEFSVRLEVAKLREVEERGRSGVKRAMGAGGYRGKDL